MEIAVVVRIDPAAPSARMAETMIVRPVRMIPPARILRPAACGGDRQPRQPDRPPGPFPLFCGRITRDGDYLIGYDYLSRK